MLGADAAWIFACSTVSPHLGEHLVAAARQRRLDYTVCDAEEAWRAPRWVGRLSWHLRDRRAPRMTRYAAIVERACRAGRGGYLLTTGQGPLPVGTLRRLGARGVVRANFSTDDPWSAAHRSRWFLDALSEYDIVFNPRRAAVDDFRRAGCRRVEYLPFAYDPTTHFPEAASSSDLKRFGCDVAFVGGADADRVPYIDALRAGGLRVRVYGGYWDRHAHLRPIWGGTVIGGEYRRCVSAAAVNLCLVRRSNRDGHVMRTFELAAMRACVLAEDTPEHREVYGGPEDGCVRYFRTLGEMVEQARVMAGDAALRARMSQALYQRVTSRPNTYADRFDAMVRSMESLRRRS